MNGMSKRGQYGAALITSLLMVLVISILGVAVSKQVIALRRVSSVNYDHISSVNNAESALSEAHKFILFNYLEPENLKGNLVTDTTRSDNWWHQESNWQNQKIVSIGLEGSPVYLLQDDGLDESLMLGTNAIQRRFYRVTAKAQGKGQAVAYLQSYYAILE
ncbi:hypothetical protein MT391_14610 [Vibrio sp. 1-Bac 57]